MGRKKNKVHKYIYMAVTIDDLETPLATADTYKDLGNILGMDASGVCRMANKGNISTIKFCGEYFRVIRVEDEEED